MEFFLGILVLAIFFGPLILAIIALVKTNSLSHKLNDLSHRLSRLEFRNAVSDSPPQIMEEAKPTPTKEQAPPTSDHTAPQPEPESAEEPQLPPKVVQPPPPPALKPTPTETQAPQEEPTHAPLHAPLHAPPKEAWVLLEEDTSEEQPPAPPKPSHSEIFNQISNFLWGGNPIAKVAIVILLFGVGFAIKLASQHGLFPIEFRLAMVGLGGAGMVLLGWKLFKKHALYSKILMAGGFATLYFTFYGAGQIWHLISLPFTSILMLLSVLAGTVFSHNFKSQSFAMLAFTGGFVAPFLTAIGFHNPIHLLGLYGLFNTALFFLVLRNNWTYLPYFGFFFTFVAASIWGYQNYQPASFWNTEPFLIFHWLLYVALGDRLARQRQKIVTTLTLGSTLAAFGLQSMLLEHNGLGLAFSSLVAALLHALLGYRAYKDHEHQLPILKEFHAILSLGLVTLSIPLALAEQWTSAAWSVEAAAVVWVGVRSQRRLLKMIGVLLLIGSGSALWIDMPSAQLPRLIGCLLVLGSSILVARLLVNKQGLLNQGIHILSLVWSVIWLGMSLHSIFEPMSSHDLEGVILGWALTMALVQLVTWRWPSWTFLQAWGYPFFVLSFLIFVDRHYEWITPIMVLSCLYAWMSRTLGKPEKAPHAVSHLVFIGMTGWILGDWATILLRKIPEIGPSWINLAHPVGLFLAIIPHHLKRKNKPWNMFDRFHLLPLAYLIVPLGIWMFIAGLTDPGRVAPLPYLPLLNPVEVLVLLFGLMVWRWKPLKEHLSSRDHLSVMLPIAGALLFAICLGGVSRFAHHFWGIPWDVEALVKSSKWQAFVSIQWTLIGVCCIFAGAKRSSRRIWVAGAVAIGAIVLKLFLVDLQFAGAGARVIAFLVVGLLLLLVGYRAPLPPAKED